MRIGRSLAALIAVGALVGCTREPSGSQVADTASCGPPECPLTEDVDATDVETVIETGPCAYRRCGVGTDGTTPCGVCEASAVPFPSYQPGISTTYCDEEAGRCGGLTANCHDGWCTVPAGSFQAGADFIASQPFWEPPPHRVRLTHAFRIQETEVTQGQWVAVMGSNPSPFAACGSDCPVSGMTWFDAIRFANLASERDGLPACYTLTGCDKPAREDYWLLCDEVTFAGLDCKGYRLPTEYEWEHAARAGSPACYSDQQLEHPTQFDATTLRADVDPNAWYCANSAADYAGCIDLPVTNPGVCSGVQPVHLKRPNVFGLHDMYGNVAELTTSVWREPDDIKALAETEGTLVDAFADSLVRRNDIIVTRGGFFAEGASLTCSAFRNRNGVWSTQNLEITGFTGLRLVQTLPAD